jgi:hypothetical protein
LVIAGSDPRARAVTFLIDSPDALAAKLDVFDVLGRRIATPFAGTLARGRTPVAWPLERRDGARVANGVYFARLTFAGGNRTAQVVVAR